MAESRQYSFLGNCLRSLFRIKGNVEGVDFNPVDYDFILLGSPVWAGSPAPALNTFLEKVSPLSGKSVCLFVTYGSGLGKDRALRIMKEKVEGKGGQVTQMLSVCEKEPFMEVVKRFKFE